MSSINLFVKEAEPGFILQTGLLFSAFLFCVSSPVFSQKPDEGFRPELETLLENQFTDDGTTDLEQLYNELQALHERPIAINQADETGLAVLHFLDPVQVRGILEYREKYGELKSVYELAAIPGFDEQLARLTGYFVHFDSKALPTASSRPARHEILTRASRLLERQTAYADPRKYEGSGNHFYLRCRSTASSFDAGFTAEKDAGESFFRASNQEGFDFYSGYVRITPPDRKWSIVLGDYVVQFGQGLVIWQGFSLGKSAESTRIGNFNAGVKAYTSSDENNFMRGVAGSFNSGRWHVTPFISRINCDANLSRENGQTVFTSLQTSGYHRTAGEIDDKNSVSVLTAGGNVRYDSERLSLGVTGVHVAYRYPLVRDDEPWNRYLFSGDRAANLSADYRYGVNSLYLFGELATNLHGGLAALNGLIFQPVDQVELSSVFRCIGRRYNSPLASAFTEGSQVNDETGFYLGGKIVPAAKVSLNMYLDVFRFNRMKYTSAAAGSGEEFMFQLNYQPTETWQLYARYFYESKPERVSGMYSDINVDRLRQSIRVNLTGEINRSLTVKSRFEQSFFRHDHYSTGFLVSQDLGYHTEKWLATVWGRIAYFKTGDYDARIYAWENDLLYQFSIPALYGEGIRSYLTGKVKICEKVEFWYKVSRTWFFGVDSIGSGNSLITGNKRTEVKFQMRFRI